MMRGFSFGSYVPGTSPVHKLDARAKLLLGCAFIVITLNARSFLALIPVALFVVGAYALARIPARKALRSLAPLLFIVVIASIMNLFVVQGGPVYFEWAFIRVSEQGVFTCLLIACRLLLMMAGMSLVTLTTMTLDLTEAFERLLSGSANGIEFRLHEIAGKYDLRDDQARVAYAQEVSGVLCTLENAVEREIYTTRAAEAAGLTPEALKMEVQRSFRRMAAKEKKTRERRELNPAASLQPQERGLRYDNLRSALAEEGVIRLLLLDDSLFGDTPPVPAESFSSPLLGRVYASLWESHMAGRPLSISSLSGELTGEEMSHLTGVVQKPESPAGGERALADYCRVIREEAQKRTAGVGTDPLAAAAEKYKNKKGYGGKHNDG